MATYSDSLIGANTELYGSAVETASDGPYAWEQLSGDMRRSAAGASLPTASSAGCYFVPDAPTAVPPAVIIEGEFNTEGTTVERLADIEYRWTGQFGAATVWVGGSVRQYYDVGNYRIYLNNGTYFTAFDDSGIYSGYVKRRLEINNVAKTFKCFANDVQIASGAFVTSNLVDGAVFNNSVIVRIYRVSGSSPTSANVRNMNLIVGAAPPPAPMGEFWTGFVNAYEVP